VCCVLFSDMRLNREFLKRYAPALTMEGRPDEIMIKEILSEGAMIMVRDDKTEVNVKGYDVILASPIPNAEIMKTKSSYYRVPMKTVSYGIVGVFVDNEDDAKKLIEVGKIFILAGILQRKKVGNEVMYSFSCFGFEEIEED